MCGASRNTRALALTTCHPIGDLSNVMRDDEVRGSFTQEVALENAPKQEDGSFLIPSILGEGGDR